MRQSRSIVFVSIFMMVGLAVSVPVAADVVASFTFSPANPVVGQEVQFTDTSTGNPNTWQWDFQNPPNGTDSTAQNPTWTFTEATTYAVRLTASVPPFDIDDVVVNVTVSPNNVDNGDLSFTSSTYFVDEDAGSAVVFVRRTGGSDGAVSVRCATTTGGTATANSDYTPTSVTLNWSDNDTSNKDCVIQIINDVLEESAETINVSLSNFGGGASPVSPTNATVTIRANDATGDAGDLSFTSSGYFFDEDAGTVGVSVRRTGGSDGAVSVRCATTTGGTATVNDDYMPTSTTLNWGDGDTSNKSCPLTIVDDDLEELAETIRLVLDNFGGGASPGMPTSATVTIGANDTSVDNGNLSFTSSGYFFDEDAGTVGVSVRRTGGSDGAVSVRCATTTGGTATVNDDYMPTSTTLNWGDGDTSNKSCPLTIVDDDSEEVAETIRLVLDNFGGGASPGTPTTTTVTIRANDTAIDAGDLSFTASNYDVDEDVGMAMIAVRRTGGSEGAVSVRCTTTIGGSATANSDYTPTADTLNWSDGELGEEICMVPILEDSITEGDEEINLSLSNFTGGASPGTFTNATITILANDVDVPGVLSFTTSVFEVNETTSTLNATVRRTGGTLGTVTVLCSTSDDSATAGQDYTETSTTLTWDGGDSTNQSCSIDIENDTIVEGDEQFMLSLSNATGGANIVSPNFALVVIEDDEDPGVLSFTSNAFGEFEDAGSVEITVERTGSFDGPVGARCSTSGNTASAGSDYTETSVDLEWAAGEGGVQVCVVPLLDDDEQNEGNETVNLTLTNPTGMVVLGQSSSVLTIRENDLFTNGFESEFLCAWSLERPGPSRCGPLVRFSALEYGVGEGGGSLTFSVERVDSSLEGAVEVSCVATDGTAVSGGDYGSFTPASLSWGHLEGGSKTCTLQILEDIEIEMAETVIVSLSSTTPDAGVGAPRTVTIMDNEIPGILSFASTTVSVDESDGADAITAIVEVERTMGSGGQVSVVCGFDGGTAMPSEDYTVSTVAERTLVWENEETQNQQCLVPITPDNLVEGNETILLTLEGVVGAAIGEPSTATVTLLDAPVDWGDAPDPSYPTLFANDGPSHRVSSLFLGASIDAEGDGQPDVNAGGDDGLVSDDEDGVVFPAGSIRAGDSSATVSITASESCLLDGWIDFNANGDWSDSEDMIFAGEVLASGPNVLSFPVPPESSVGATISRWRCSSDGGLLPTGPAPDGEVEDHRVTITPQLFMLTVIEEGMGSVFPSSGTYADGTTLNLAASPALGWRFDGWSGDLSGSASPQSLTMDSDKTVTATFIEQFTLTTSVVGMGTVDPSSGTYDTGTMVSLTATPEPGWRFAGWSGDLSGSVSPATLTMDSDKSVTATFIEEFTLTTSVIGMGTVDPSSGTYDTGTMVSLTATPEPGWRFAGWSGDLSGSVSPATLTMDSDKSVTATFIEEFTLTTSVIGMGTVDPSSGTYDTGAMVSLTATPEPGWRFAGWSGDLSGSVSPATLTMDSDKSVTATFIEEFTLTTSVIGMGTVDPSSGTYDTGAMVSLTATPEPGWRFAGWSGDLSGSVSPATLTMDSDKSVTATFIEEFTLTTSVIGMGTVDPSSGTYDTGTMVSLTATPEPGWRFAGWSGDLSGSVSPATLTMDSDKSVTATFIEEFTLTTSVIGMGTVDPSSGTYDTGTMVSLTATPEPGWRFAGWSGDLSGSVSPATLTMDSDKSVTATFIEEFTLTTSVIGMGTVDPSSGTYDTGTMVSLTATPEPGWRFAGWSGDLTGSVSPAMVTMDSEKTVTATFIEQFTLTVNTAGMGTVTLSPLGGIYDVGTEVTLTASPTGMKTFDGWSGDLSGTNNPETITMDAAKSVTATFQ